MALPSRGSVADPPAPVRDVIRIVLVDRDSLARRAMREAITARGEFTVAAEAATAAETVSCVRSARPDLVLIDIGYPHLDGIAAAGEVRRVAPTTPVVFCSIVDDDDTAVSALRSGAAGYVRKDLGYPALSRALRGALAGEAAISRRLGMRLIEELSRAPNEQPRPRPAGGELTAREWEVLDLLIDGESTTAIAERLGLALETVRSHIKHVLRKLGVGSRAEAIDITRRLRGRRA